MTPGEIETLPIAELIRRAPGTARVFLLHRMSCPGCLMAPFMTVDDAAGEYQIDAEALKRDLIRAIEAEEALQ
ncbi:MAG: hypothetical protein TEF_12150 [Rhizobiales bacterium NRL2]|jgi:hybrid cluster-associated redox disulfide protein|nr:MAG: hypothetical protein TEF_02735 [Rhizobiales bacterium NRL2]ANK81470.1 MAG: hypothetical protein TEF_12150 [Rhizobiales bacterium NRL2]